jgi:hypothetical protein
MVDVEHIPTARIGNNATPRGDPYCFVAGQSLAKTILVVANIVTVIFFMFLGACGGTRADGW